MPRAPLLLVLLVLLAPLAAADGPDGPFAPPPPPDLGKLTAALVTEFDVLHVACVSSAPPFVATGSCTGYLCATTPGFAVGGMRCEDLVTYVPKPPPAAL